MHVCACIGNGLSLFFFSAFGAMDWFVAGIGANPGHSPLFLQTINDYTRLLSGYCHTI